MEQIKAKLSLCAFPMPFHLHLFLFYSLHSVPYIAAELILRYIGSFRDILTSVPSISLITVANKERIYGLIYESLV